MSLNLIARRFNVSESTVKHFTAAKNKVLNGTTLEQVEADAIVEVGQKFPRTRDGQQRLIAFHHAIERANHRLLRAPGFKT